MKSLQTAIEMGQWLDSPVTCTVLHILHENYAPVSTLRDLVSRGFSCIVHAITREYDFHSDDEVRAMLAELLAQETTNWVSRRDSQFESHEILDPRFEDSFFRILLSVDHAVTDRCPTAIIVDDLEVAKRIAAAVLGMLGKDISYIEEATAHLPGSLPDRLDQIEKDFRTFQRTVMRRPYDQWAKKEMKRPFGKPRDFS
jgi:hypothetical protein